MVQKFTFVGGLVDLVDSATDLSNCLVDSLIDTEEGIKNNSELNDSGIDLSTLTLKSTALPPCPSAAAGFFTLLLLSISLKEAISADDIPERCEEERKVYGNQQNLGTIKSSHLCIEIIEYTNPIETAVCNLASIALPRYVREKGVPAESQPSKLVGSRGSNNRKLILINLYLSSSM
ncbi:hypothetical protein L2E82_10729 [Cichorium intybus]|uniref:Uncharacterized protein n=1 Tax=Cichorium intybus TaxID=13427 RepID=A0ACB9GBZ5_CICIN|nr:hypothetical protein L2E82_10729 [Cichorium intybus]